LLSSSRQRILELVDDEAVVVDVGGWADPFERADWVIDLMPYETRGLYEREGWMEPRERAPEHFDASTWIERDVCARKPFPFEDGSVDFVICTQTLEDVRDPVWVCSELARIGKAGYIEVPSRLEEQSVGVKGRFAGWPHHRWLIDVDGPRIEFVLKPHDLHFLAGATFPAGFLETLAPKERVETLWWEGSFEYGERIFVDEAAGHDHVSGLVSRTLAQRGFKQPLRSRLVSALRSSRA
jgi:hypothetical protein